MNKPNFKILDCTPRDGGYINNWNFPLEMVCEMYQATSKAGTDIFEVGFLGGGKDAPLWRRCPAEAVAEVRRHAQSKTPISAMLEADTVGIRLDSPDKTGIDILRVALNRDKIHTSLPKMSEYKQQGYQVLIQLMGITAYTDYEILRMMEEIEKTGYVDYINIADSYGSLLPARASQIISMMKRNTSLCIGLHPHNNMQLGMANVLAAIDAGADIVDGSMYGMGRGGGNVPLELLLAYFGRKYPEKYNVLPVLEFVDRYMVQMSHEMEWGYSLNSLLSGVYECHPYYTQKLIEEREFTVEQVLKIVKAVSTTDVIGFSRELMLKVINDTLLDESKEKSITIEQFVKENTNRVPYVNRHQGQSILVLANGPTLVSHKKQIDELIETENPIVMGANNLAGLFVPDYHAFNNQRRFNQYINDVSDKSKILIGPGIKNRGIDKEFEEIVCYNSSVSDLNIINGVITSNCRSIAVLMGAIALAMGAKKLYFAGLDGYLDGKTLFYHEDESSDNVHILEKHKANQKYLKELYECAQKLGCEEFRIITPTTYTI